MQQPQNNRQKRLFERNQRIRKRFRELTEKKHFNLEHSLMLLAQEYLELTQDTLWLIISQTGHYKNK